MELNTVFQLYSLSLNRPYQLDRADCLLLMPDLFNYMLTGVKASEYTNCTTTQLLDAAKGTWSHRVWTPWESPHGCLLLLCSLVR